MAAYYVHWALGHVPDRGANIDLIVGEWGEAATRERRRAGLSLPADGYRPFDNGDRREYQARFV
jgi:hypothetical protein